MAAPPRRSEPYVDLSPDQCGTILAQQSIGGIAWTAADGPQLFPVSYWWNDGLVIFRTSPYGVLSELVRRTDVVFEVDDLDPSTKVGGSVILHRTAEGMASPESLTTPFAAALPWTGGDRHLIIGIRPRSITGRWFGRPTRLLDGQR